MIRVGVNGFGTIGKRVADAVAAQPDMTVAGVTKRSPDYEATIARRRGFDLYAADPARNEEFAARGLSVAGGVEALLEASDVVIDATPAGVGEGYRPLYSKTETPAVFQGGEDETVAEESFNAPSNFADARGADAVRVVSCNTTGLCRLLSPLRAAYGIDRVQATLIRRGGDPTQPDRGPINDILPDPVTTPSHHGPDVRTVLPDVDIHTFGVTVPATVMHLHAVCVTLDAAVTAEDVRSLLAGEPRVELVPGELAADSCGLLRDLARDAGRPRGDVWENCVWEESISAEGRELCLFQAINQESNVVPENVDAVRALLGTANAAESRRTTNERLGMGLTRRDRASAASSEPLPEC